jgi:hypothetical protein
MAVDPYAPCPCGSGKKLKFCCGDLADDIEKVHRMLQGEQPHAALKHVEHLLEKDPGRASLLDLRALLELSLHSFDAARQTIDAFVAAHPKNASAHAHAAILAASTESGAAAIARLQDSLELLNDEIPLRVLEAIGAVGQALLLEGDLIAARGHLLLYAGIAPEGDNRGLELLLRMNLQAGLPLLMRDYLILAECPPDVSWRKPYLDAMRHSDRGLWRKAETGVAKLRKEAGPAPAIVSSLALLRGWLGNVEQFAAGLHEYAALDVPTDDAVEAEALAQLVDPHVQDPKLETVRLVYPITDVDALAECLAADKRVEDYPLDPRGQEETTLPRSTHILLDRVPPASGTHLERTEVPRVVGFLSVYGKRTDREAQLDFTTERNEEFQRVEALLREITGESMGEVVETEVLVEKSLSEASLSWRWRLPNDTPPDLRRKLLAEERREVILSRWTTAPRGALRSKPPRDAVGDPNLRIALMASVLIIEQAAVDPAELPLFAELRKQLDLPLPAPCDPGQVDLEHVPLVRIPRLELAQASDDELARLLDRTVLMGAQVAILLVAAELVGRTQLAERIDLATAYRQLVHLEPDHQRALGWIEKARAWSRSQGKSEAEWALLELELAIERGDGLHVQRVLNEIRDQHVNEQGVAEAAYQILYAAGLVAPPGEAGARTPSTRQPVAAAPSANGGQRIWTPGGDAPASQTESGDKPAIWTP